MSVYSFLDRPIAFHRSFIKLKIGVTGALFLSQAIYWSHRTRDPEGWFYKTGVEWEEETGLTRREQDGARRKLRNLGIISEEKRGVPCRIHYRVNADILNSLMLELLKSEQENDAPNVQTSLHKSANTVCTKAPNKIAPNVQTNTEITTEITKEENTSLLAEKSATPKKRKNRTSMPEDFQPTEQHKKLAESLGVNLSAVFPQFADYHAAKGSKFVDWHAALRTWIRNDAKFRAGNKNKKQTYFREETKDKNYWEGINDDGTF